MWSTGTRFVDFKLESIMTTLPDEQDADTKENRVTIGSVRKVAAVPAGFIVVVCLWALIGLMVTALIVACVGRLILRTFSRRQDSADDSSKWISSGRGSPSSPRPGVRADKGIAGGSARRHSDWTSDDFLACGPHRGGDNENAR
jgi:hypothetical protein